VTVGIKNLPDDVVLFGIQIKVGHSLALATLAWIFGLVLLEFLLVLVVVISVGILLGFAVAVVVLEWN